MEFKVVPVRDLAGLVDHMRGLESMFEMPVGAHGGGGCRGVQTHIGRALSLTLAYSTKYMDFSR